MKKVLYIAITILMLGATGFLLFALSQGRPAMFTGVIGATGNEVPYLTSLLMSNIQYWWVILITIVVVGIIPLFFSRLKTSLLLSFSGMCLVVFSAYANVFYTLTNV
jgi:hypothetical protein